MGDITFAGGDEERDCEVGGCFPSGEKAREVFEKKNASIPPGDRVSLSYRPHISKA
jgi:hypothetical protein